MGKDEASTKKRRKLNTSSSSDISKQVVPVDVYKVCDFFIEIVFVIVNFLTSIRMCKL